MSRLLHRRNVQRLAPLLLLAVVLVWRSRQPADEAAPPSTTGNATAVENAFRDRSSGIMLDVAGRVQRVLADDNDGSRHQRFLVELPSGHTVLVAHNIDLAQRVPLAAGDPITLRGQFEWNERGGVLHWTHRDPDGRHEGGWIDHRGQRYH